MNCQNPALLGDESITIIGFRKPAIRGADVALTCIPGLMLLDPNSSTCMGDGEWEPDPREAANVDIITYDNREDTSVEKKGQQPMTRWLRNRFLTM